MPQAPPTRRRWFQFGFGTMLVLVTVFAVWLAWWNYLWDDHLCTYQFSQRRAVVLRYQIMCEMSASLYYEVYHDGAIVVPQFSFDGADCPCDATCDEFRAFELPENIVVIQRHRRSGAWTNVIIHDFSSGKSFPYNARRDEFSVDLDNAIGVTPEKESSPPKKRVGVRRA